MTPKFTRAKPQQAALKLLFYAPQGAGKTFTALLVAEGLAARDGKRIAVIDTERGTDFYAQAIPKRTVHPEAFDFDALYTRSLAGTIDALRSLDPKEHSVVVIDSISHLWDAAINAYKEKRTSGDSIPFPAWAGIKRPYKRDVIQWLMDSPYHVILCGRQRSVYDTSTDEWKRLGVEVRAERESGYEPHFTARFEVVRDPKDTARSTYLMIVEKDRMGVLAGRTFANPSFKTFEPMLEYLGTRQAVSEDPDEVVERDSALQDEEARKVAVKLQESTVIKGEFTSKIGAARTLQELAVVADEIKKKRTKLVEAHRNELAETYTATQKALQS